MTTERPASQTAIGVAWLRAAHQCLDGADILRDPVVLQLFGDAADRITRHPERFQAPGARALRAHVVLRSRIAEDALREAVRHGTTQYVVLGAGYDTFAYRQPTWAEPVQIFEVDHPASQREKQNALAAAGLAIPRNLTYVPVDFERERLADRLREAGLRLDERVFVSWLGVTMYLTLDAIEAVLQLVAGFPRGSEIVFTFAEPRDPRSEGGALAARAAEVGEPWVSYFTRDEIHTMLRWIGYSTVELFTPETVRERYFTATSSLPVPRRVSIARGVV